MDFKTMIRTLKRLKDDNRGLVELVYIAVYLGIAVVAGAIILYITQAVTSITQTSGTMNMTYNTSNLSANNHLVNASNQLYNTADIGFSFLPIVAVAAIGSVAIGY